MAAGIYVIRNTATGEFYIGSSVRLASRLSYHRQLLRRGKHDNKRLQTSWGAFAGAFVFELLCILPESEIRATEQRMLDRLARRPDCFNESTVVGGFPEWTPERREAARQRARNRERKPWSAESRARLSATKRLRCADPEIRALEAAKFAGAPKGFLGKRHSPEARAKLAAKTKGRVPWNLGRPHSEETRKKIGAKTTSRANASPEWREKISRANRGRKQSDAERRARSEATKKGHDLRRLARSAEV